MSVYREPASGAAPPIKYICDGTTCTYPLCECGHKHDDHFWFNSEFIECIALGHYSESVIRGERSRHQPIAHCKCERYREKSHGP